LRSWRASRENLNPKTISEGQKKEGQKVRISEYQNERTLKNSVSQNRATCLKSHSNLQDSNLQASIFSLRFLRASRENFNHKNNIGRPEKEGQKVRMAEYQNECTLKNRVCETGHNLHEGHSNLQASNLQLLIFLCVPGVLRENISTQKQYRKIRRLDLSFMTCIAYYELT
jgi:hypothetical protein